MIVFRLKIAISGPRGTIRHGRKCKWLFLWNWDVEETKDEGVSPYPRVK
jgi:hypothetical protein